MTLHRGRTTPPAESGFALIEVLVSALIAVIMTGAVISLLNATGRAGAEERHRSQAYSVAQEDQARMRGMQISSLNGYEETRTVTVGGNPYTVLSKASFVNDKTSELNCSSGVGSADYVKIGSKVTWPSLGSGRSPVQAESIITPPNGSLDPTRGTLTINAVNAQNTPISGVGVSGKGPSTFSGSTDSTGCVIYPNIPEGNYTVTPSLAAGYVDKDGNAPSAQTVGVVGNSTKTLSLVYDQEGGIEANFKVRGYSGAEVASQTDSVIYVNNQMTTAEHLLGTPGGTEKSSFLIKPLFPFKSSPYSVYAGSCEENDPESGASAASVSVTAGATTTATVLLPALYLTVKSGSSPISGAAVTVEDTKCNFNGKAVKRSYTTNSSGQLSDPGFPWSTYKVCASAKISGTTRHESKTVTVHNATGTAVEISLTSSDTSGTC